MTDTMIERVARAMFNRRFPNIDFDTLDGTGALGVGAKAYKNDFRADAKAAIAAMREPTEAMVRAANSPPTAALIDEYAPFYPPIRQPGFADFWHAAIDEALKDD